MLQQPFVSDVAFWSTYEFPTVIILNVVYTVTLITPVLYCGCVCLCVGKSIRLYCDKCVCVCVCGHGYF
jgi:hypothetical protein